MRCVASLFIIIGLGVCFVPTPSRDLHYVTAMMCRAVSLGLLCALPAVIFLFSAAGRILFLPTAFVCFGVGVLINGSLTALIGLQCDHAVAQAVEALRSQSGFLTMEYPDRRPMSISPTATGYIRRDPLPPLPANLLPLAVYTEDKRFLNRPTSIDSLALLRAIKANVIGKTQGASGVVDQLASLLANLRTDTGSPLRRIESKIVKFLLGWRLFDRYDKDVLVHMLLQTLPFGGRGGQDVRGVESCARIDYDKPFLSLSRCEQLEVLSRAPSPAVFDPYAARLDRYRAHFDATLKAAVRDGLLEAGEANRCLTGFLSTVVPKPQSVHNATRPFLNAVMTEIKNMRGIVSGQHLRLGVSFDSSAQLHLEDSRRKTLNRLRRNPLVSRHGNSVCVEVDAVLLSPGGELAAEVGAPKITGGASSYVKACVAAASVELGIVESVEQRIPKTNVRVTEMLYNSDSNAAMQLGRLLGGQRLDAALKACGYTIPPNRRAPMNAIGYGVEADLRTIAATWVYSFSEPGIAHTPHWIRRITGDNGYEWLHTAGRRIYSAQTAVQIRDALTFTSKLGTTRHTLNEFSAQGHAIKTGTPAYRSGRQTYLGSGGSIAVAALRDGRILAVRTRYCDGRPFEINGADSAAVFIAYFLQLQGGPK